MAKNGALVAFSKTAPGPRWHKVPRILMLARDNPLQFLLKTTQEYGDLVEIDARPIDRFYVTCRPEHVEHVLVENHRNYSKQTRDFETLKPMLGEGLLTSDGAFWLKQRRTIQPAFDHKRVDEFAHRIAIETEEMLAEWDKKAARAERFDVLPEMMRLTLSIVAKALFSADVRGVQEAVGGALDELNRQAAEDAKALVDLPHCIPTPRNRRASRALKTLDDVVYRIIAERRAKPGRREDLMSLLLNARDPETSETMSDKQVRDEVLTLLLAGHETTANALSWTWYLLSKNPGAARRMQEEIDRVLAGRMPELRDTPALVFTKMVVQESMRLYPPAWGMSRHVEADDVIGGYKIKAGSTMFISQYLIHRNPANWENPEGFDPERFLPERAESRPRFAYFPFGGGGRLCIGKDFAMLEAQLIVSAIARRFALELVPGHPVEPEPLVTLRPKHGIMVSLRRRSA